MKWKHLSPFHWSKSAQRTREQDQSKGSASITPTVSLDRSIVTSDPPTCEKARSKSKKNSVLRRLTLGLKQSSGATLLHVHDVRVVAYGEEFRVPVTPSTRIGHVVHCVAELAMEANIANVRIVDAEGVLFYRDVALPVDMRAAAIPSNAVLHFHLNIESMICVQANRTLLLSTERQQQGEDFRGRHVSRCLADAFGNDETDGSAASSSGASRVTGSAGDGGPPSSYWVEEGRQRQAMYETQCMEILHAEYLGKDETDKTTIFVETPFGDGCVSNTSSLTGSEDAETRSCTTTRLRRFRVDRSFPVATLRELLTVCPELTLYYNNYRITDENRSFDEYGITPYHRFAFRPNDEAVRELSPSLLLSRTESGNLHRRVREGETMCTSLSSTQVFRTGTSAAPTVASTVSLVSDDERDGTALWRQLVYAARSRNAGNDDDTTLSSATDSSYHMEKSRVDVPSTSALSVTDAVVRSSVKPEETGDEGYVWDSASMGNTASGKSSPKSSQARSASPCAEGSSTLDNHVFATPTPPYRAAPHPGTHATCVSETRLLEEAGRLPPPPQPPSSTELAGEFATHPFITSGKSAGKRTDSLGDDTTRLPMGLRTPDRAVTGSGMRLPLFCEQRDSSALSDNRAQEAQTRIPRTSPPVKQPNVKANTQEKALLQERRRPARPGATPLAADHEEFNNALGKVLFRLLGDDADAAGEPVPSGGSARGIASAPGRTANLPERSASRTQRPTTAPYDGNADGNLIPASEESNKRASPLGSPLSGAQRSADSVPNRAPMQAHMGQASKSVRKRVTELRSLYEGGACSSTSTTASSTVKIADSVSCSDAEASGRGDISTTRSMVHPEEVKNDQSPREVHGSDGSDESEHTQLLPIIVAEFDSGEVNEYVVPVDRLQSVWSIRDWLLQELYEKDPSRKTTLSGRPAVYRLLCNNELVEDEDNPLVTFATVTGDSPNCVFSLRQVQ